VKARLDSSRDERPSVNDTDSFGSSILSLLLNSFCIPLITHQLEQPKQQTELPPLDQQPTQDQQSQQAPESTQSPANQQTSTLSETLDNNAAQTLSTTATPAATTTPVFDFFTESYRKDLCIQILKQILDQITNDAEGLSKENSSTIENLRKFLSSFANNNSITDSTIKSIAISSLLGITIASGYLPEVLSLSLTTLEMALNSKHDVCLVFDWVSCF
jgi:hypothetical protein